MTHAFPEQTVKNIYEKAKIFVQNSRNKTKYSLAKSIMASFQDAPYGFKDNLRTGNYAPYPHEQTEQHIITDNCTTIIPHAYLYCEAVGLQPKIVQFIKFRDIKKNETPDAEKTGSHYALKINIGKKHEYLIDPFWKIFGPITEQKNDYIKIGKCAGLKARKREFESIINYSPEQFAHMMNRLKDPAESLDMLVAGQKATYLPLNKTNCTLMAYYQDEQNTLITRLYIPQTGLRKKAVYCKMQHDENGNTQKTTLELYTAKDHTWDALIDDKKIAEIDFKTAQEIKKIARKITRKKNSRIGPALEKQANKEHKQKLLEITEQAYNKLSTEELQNIRETLQARTRYETEAPQKMYIYTKQKHDSKIIELREKEIELHKKNAELKNQMWYYDWKIKKTPRKNLQKLKRKQAKYHKEAEKIVKEIIDLCNLRYQNKNEYRRTMDKILFAQNNKNQTSEQNLQITETNPDVKIGYIAILADFADYIIPAKKDLQLTEYISSIQQKIKARAQKKATAKTAEKTKESQDTANTLLNLLTIN